MSHDHGTDHTPSNPFDTDDPSALYSKKYWDDRYASTDAVWSGNPNQRLVEQVADLTPGTALDVGSGEGGDVIWLASRGWKVTGVDVSQVGLDRAAGHAADRGVEVADRISWQQVDLVTWDPAPATFDLVTAHFIHLPKELLTAVHVRLAAAVNPGGSLLIVGHHPSDMEARIGHAHRADFFYSAEDIAKKLPTADWEIRYAGAPEREAKLDPQGDVVTIHDAVLHAVRR
jgi:2-polyprenyl-3-methyl-5-hydroxy-6-metoxy-1,4-benzoquinol methylase